MKQSVVALLLGFSLFFSAGQSQAATRSDLGVHILRTDELAKAVAFIDDDDVSTSSYVTIPYSYADMKDPWRWQTFFEECGRLGITPIVRLTTEFHDGVWAVPTQKQVADQISSLDALVWPGGERYIIVYNEVNHAAEWGGTLDPAGYSDILEFATNWAHSESADFVVLPAAMDLDAPNSVVTMEAFSFLRQMQAYNPEVLQLIDVWNSHSYPNPGFTASPERVGKNSVRGFTAELALLKELTGRDLHVMITETGWRDNGALFPWLESYYEYAMQHVWSDSRVIAVTPFILQGAPGPFAGFSMLDESGELTSQGEAVRKIVAPVSGEEKL